MTQPSNEMSDVAQLKLALQSTDDESLRAFLRGYSIGLAANYFISIMITPNQRAEFLIAVAKTYPDEWKQAIEMLQGR